MDFSDAVVFIAAIIIVTGAGIALGTLLSGRGHKKTQALAPALARKADLYADLISALDTLHEADDRRKQWFIHRYYQALILAPDAVIVSVNRFLDGVTAESPAAEKLMELRGQAVKAMRDDVQQSYAAPTKLALPELYKVEVRPQGVVHDEDDAAEPVVTKAEKNRK